MLLFVSKTADANDGVFYARGNQLIPMFETNISVKKEILTITKISFQYIKVVVYYEFFNPGKDRKVEVGFEAISPSGDVNGTPVNGRHPYIHDFTVTMNQETLPYKVALVSDAVYYKNGKFIEKSVAEAIQGIDNTNEVNFDYVYHFQANFKKGLNIISHTYLVDVSGSVEMNYDFDYILTAATRWANKQIDDFTLILQLGDLEDFYINNSFLQKGETMTIAGTGKKIPVKKESMYFLTTDHTRYIVQQGYVFYQALNYRPKAELQLFAKNGMWQEETFDHTTYKDLPFSISQANYIASKAVDASSLKILKNLPYARRGYVFTNKFLQDYFSKLIWYIPNPNFIPDLKRLTPKEQEWLDGLGLVQKE
jgi:hypothetical protein